MATGQPISTNYTKLYAVHTWYRGSRQTVLGGPNPTRFPVSTSTFIAIPKNSVPPPSGANENANKIIVSGAQMDRHRHRQTGPHMLLLHLYG